MPLRKKRRPTIYTPGFSFDEIDFAPTREEYTLDWLRAKQEQWKREDIARQRKRLAEILEHVERDREAAERQEIVERELKVIQDYYATEHEKEGKAADVKRRAAVDRILKRVARDKAEAEREALAARGVLRGRTRKSWQEVATPLVR